MRREIGTGGVLLAVIMCTLFLMSGMATAAFFTTSPNDEHSEPDQIALSLDISGDEMGAWTIEHRYRLADDNDSAAFDALQSDIEDQEEQFIEQFRERMQETVSSGVEATGRPMKIDNISVDTERRSLPQEYGIVRYSFDWHDFAVKEDDQIRAGDAIGGLFLDEQSSLKMIWNESYSVATVSPEPDAQDGTSAVWNGPRDFDEAQPWLVVEKGGGPPLRMGWPFAFIILGGLSTIVGGTWWYLYRRDAHSESESIPHTDESLLSNEERVLAILESEGGRLRQQEIVQRLDWTDAKTSQVVSNLREDGQIESFRIGRENVLRLPDSDDA